jgi:hypothetical protein
MDSLALYAMAQAAQFAVPVNAAPTSTNAAGTPTPNSTVETMDSVLSTYQCTLIAGRRYRAVLDGLVGNGSVTGDTFVVNIRNSGTSSGPTTASTLVAQQEWVPQTTGSGGRAPIPVGNSFIAPASGLNTFAVFAQRTGGSGIFTPLSPPSGVRELYVVYLGVV